MANKLRAIRMLLRVLGMAGIGYGVFVLAMLLYTYFNKNQPTIWVTGWLASLTFAGAELMGYRQGSRGGRCRLLSLSGLQMILSIFVTSFIKDVAGSTLGKMGDPDFVRITSLAVVIYLIFLSLWWSMSNSPTSDQQKAGVSDPSQAIPL